MTARSGESARISACDRLGSPEILELLEQRHRAQLVERQPRGARQEEHLEQVAGRAREADDVALAGFGARVAARATDDVEGLEDLARRRRQVRAIAGRGQLGALEQAGQQRLPLRLGQGCRSRRRRRLASSSATALSCTAECWRRSMLARWKPNTSARRRASRSRPRRNGSSPGAVRQPSRSCEIVEVALRVRIAALGAVGGAGQAGAHVPQLLAPGLAAVARRPRGHLGKARAIGGDGGPERRRRRHASRRDGDGAAQHLGVAHQAIDGDAALTLESHPGHVGGDVGVAVAVAADPGAIAEKRPDLEAFVRVARGQHILELPIERGRDLEERALERLQPRTHLVGRRRANAARLVAAVERDDRLAQLLGAAPLGVDPGARIVERVERGRDVAQVIEDGAAARLRRMRGQDRHDEEALQKRAHLVGRDLGAAEVGAQGGDGAIGRRARAIAPAQDAHAMLLLGAVDEVEEVGGAARGQVERSQVERADAIGQRRAPARQCARAQLERHAAELADETEGAVALARVDGVVEDSAQSLDVGDELIG